MKTIILLACVALAGCNRYGGNYSDGYQDNSAWLGLMNQGVGMMTYQPPRPVMTNCSTFGQRGMGMSCTSY